MKQCINLIENLKKKAKALLNGGSGGDESSPPSPLRHLLLLQGSAKSDIDVTSSPIKSKASGSSPLLKIANEFAASNGDAMTLRSAQTSEQSCVALVDSHSSTNKTLAHYVNDQATENWLHTFKVRHNI